MSLTLSESEIVRDEPCSPQEPVPTNPASQPVLVRRTMYPRQCTAVQSNQRIALPAHGRSGLCNCPSMEQATVSIPRGADIIMIHIECSDDSECHLQQVLVTALQDYTASLVPWPLGAPITAHLLCCDVSVDPHELVHTWMHLRLQR